MRIEKNPLIRLVQNFEAHLKIHGAKEAARLLTEDGYLHWAQGEKLTPSDIKEEFRGIEE